MTFVPDQPETSGGDLDEHERWVTVARTLAREFAKTAVQRERDNVLPRQEIQTLKDAGLVNLLIPREFGGEGGRFSTAVQVVEEITQGDGSLGALLSFQYKTSIVPAFFDPHGEAEAIARRSAQGSWLWGNLHVPRLEATPNEGGGFTVNGTAHWSTGSGLGDVATVVARRTDKRELLYAVVPTDRQGFVVQHDWDHLGLRLAETVTVEARDLQVFDDELFETASGPIVSFPPLFLPVASTFNAAVFIGSAWGAFYRARDFTLTRPPRRFARGIAAGDARASKDIPTLARFGGIWGPLKAAEALVRDAALAIDAVWSRRPDFSDEDIDTLTLRAVSARAYSQNVALDATQSVYDISGTSATANTFGFDRHWRDVRTLAQHDPLAYVHKSVGESFLTATPIRVPALV
jgi:alkylation response protein AidB-like acyl-CoA dehydrogenase